MTEFFTELILDPDRIGPRTVAFVYKSKSRDIVTFQLAVHGDRLRLDTAHRTEHENRPVKNAQRTFHLDGEIDVSRRIDDVDRMIFPGDVRCRRGDRDPSFTFEIHGIHGGADTVFALYFVNGVNLLAVIQDTFRQGCLSGVNMGADTDIAHQFK